MQAKTARQEKTAKPRRKLTRAERKQIEAVVRKAKGDGKAHTVQDSIPFRNMFPDGLCRLAAAATRSVPATVRRTLSAPTC